MIPSQSSHNTIEKFWEKVDVKSTNECWNWIGAKKPSGYGNCYCIDRYTYRSAHRLSWEIHNGAIPDGKLVLHKCDNKSCVNPGHLYLGTQSDNISDIMKRNPTPPELTAHAKLYEGEIWLVRKLRVYLGKSPSGRNKYKFSTYQVGKMFKMSPQAILKIWNSDKSLCKEGRYV